MNIEYPRWRHNGSRSVLVHSYEDEQKLGTLSDEWFETPSAAWKAKAEKEAAQHSEEPTAKTLAVAIEQTPEGQKEIIVDAPKKQEQNRQPQQSFRPNPNFNRNPQNFRKGR